MAVLLLDAGHQLLLGAVVQDDRPPLRPLEAAARGSAGQNRHGSGAGRGLGTRYLAWETAMAPPGDSDRPGTKPGSPALGTPPGLALSRAGARALRARPQRRAQFQSRPRHAPAQWPFFFSKMELSSQVPSEAEMRENAWSVGGGATVIGLMLPAPPPTPGGPTGAAAGGQGGAPPQADLRVSRDAECRVSSVERGT